MIDKEAIQRRLARAVIMVHAAESTLREAGGAIGTFVELEAAENMASRITARARIAFAADLCRQATSIGLVLARQRTRGAAAIRIVLEATVVSECRSALDRLDLGHAMLIEHGCADDLPAALQDASRASQSTSAPCILTGRATSIQTARRAFREAGVPTNRILTKAFWAPGKTGLD